MKKSLVLAMAMALGVTASAYAANPFSDVPAGHWAYDSVNKLVAAGVVDGYPDGTYGGDKLMTRYEMAQIVAKAMAKGADVDKLAAEFADELDTLGVRVANLEKKSDNVKVTGEVRYRYQDSDMNGNDDNSMRNRIWVTGQINDDWSYTGMIENKQDFSDDEGNEDTKFQRAYVTGKIGGLNVLAGRYNMFIADGNIYDTRADGVEVSYGEKLKVTGFAGKATDAVNVYDEDKDKVFDGAASYGDYAGASVDYDMGALKLNGGYINFKDMLTGKIDNGAVVAKTDVDNAIWWVGAGYDFDKNTSLTAMYLKGDMSTADDDVAGWDDDGYVIGLNYKGAKADEVGSWGLWAKYYDQGAQTVVAHTTDANYFNEKGYSEGFKGYGVGTSYTFAKNIVGNVAWYDTESKLNSNKDDQRIVADLYFTF